ncbi:MAG TPA: hypothetical protein VNB23_06245 [Ramlibacter sp.]|nr:hypothetical protein [Ramlibacter sp.]
MEPKRKPADIAADPSRKGDEALRARRAADDSQMFASPTSHGEADSTVDRSSTDPQDAAPTVGKTTGRGAKAERPSPKSERQQKTAPVESSRTSKPPAETPRARTAGWGKPMAAAS